jgi:Flp pilus assembly protein CpaB
VILVVAVAVGAVAAFGLWNYVRNVEGSVYDNAEPETVWVVTQTIAKGTTAEQAINQQLISQTEIPASFRPSTAIIDPVTELAGLVAVADLPANATLVTGNFVAPSVVTSGITDRLEERGLVTVTFSVDQVKGAAYLIEPGDFVNVLTLKGLNDTGSEEAAVEGGAVGFETIDVGGGVLATDVDGSASYDFVVRYVYQAAEVLAIDKELTPDLGETEEEAATVVSNGGMITLAVPPQAVQMILSVGMENLYLSLVPKGYEPVPLPPMDYSNSTYPGEDEQRLTPYGPDGAVLLAQ